MMLKNDIGKVEAEYKHEGQDRTEKNRNKLLWKRIAALWTLVGNDISAAKFNEWVGVEEKKDTITFKKSVSDVKHYFSNSSYILLNDFKRILSFFDRTANISDYAEILSSFSEISKKKPELEFLAIDVVIYRFIELSQNIDQKILFKWFKERNLSYNQELQLVEQVIKIRESIKYEYYKLYSNNETIILILKNILGEIEYGYIPDELVETTREIVHKINVRDFFRKKNARFENIFEYMTLQKKIYTIHPFLIDKRNYHENMERLFDEFFHGKRPRYELDENPQLALEYLKLLNELKGFYPIEKLGMRNEKFFFRFFEEMPEIFDRSMRHNPQLALEYLKLLNELKGFYPIEKLGMRNEKFFFRFFEEMPEIFDRSMRHNPQLALEYLKLLNELKGFYPIEKLGMRNEKFFFRFFEEMPEQLDRSMRHNPQLALEYLKLINEMKNYFPIEKSGMINEKFFYRFFEKYPTLKKMYLNNEGIDELLMLIKESKYEKYN